MVYRRQRCIFLPAILYAYIPEFWNGRCSSFIEYNYQDTDTHLFINDYGIGKYKKSSTVCIPWYVKSAAPYNMQLLGCGVHNDAGCIDNWGPSQ